MNDHFSTAMYWLVIILVLVFGLALIGQPLIESLAPLADALVG